MDVPGAAVGGLRIQVGARQQPRPTHKRLKFTAAQWAVVAGLAGGEMPPPLRPAGRAGDQDPGAVEAEAAVVAELRSAGVLTDDDRPTAASQVQVSLALLASSPVAVHVQVTGKATAREVWWAMDTYRAVGAYLRADGGVEWVVCEAAAAAGLMPAVVPEVADLVAVEQRGGGITSGLTSLTGDAGARPRAAFTLPLALLAPADPLAGLAPHPAGVEGTAQREERQRATALLSACRGTLTAHVYAMRPAAGDGPARMARGDHTWLATGEGWWSVTRQPAATGSPADGGPRVRLRPVGPVQLPATLAPLLTAAFARQAPAPQPSTRPAGHSPAAERDQAPGAGGPQAAQSDAGPLREGETGGR